MSGTTAADTGEDVSSSLKGTPLAKWNCLVIKSPVLVCFSWIWSGIKSKLVWSKSDFEWKLVCFWSHFGHFKSGIWSGGTATGPNLTLPKLGFAFRAVDLRHMRCGSSKLWKLSWELSWPYNHPNPPPGYYWTSFAMDQVRFADG